MTGGVSVEDKSKRSETVTPQFGECCEGQPECDGVLQVKSDGNDNEFERRDGRRGHGARRHGI